MTLIDDLSDQITDCERDLRRLGADHAYVSTLMTTPGIVWVLGYTIAPEIGDIGRFASPDKLVAYIGLCPGVHQSGNHGVRAHAPLRVGLGRSLPQHRHQRPRRTDGLRAVNGRGP